MSESEPIDPPAEGATSPAEKPRRKASWRGCALALVALGAPLLAGGIYLLTRWDNLSGGVKPLAVMSVVLGTLLLSPFALMLVALIFIRAFFRDVSKNLSKAVKEMGDAGGSILKFNKAMYDSVHEYRVAGDADFATVDRHRYDAVASELARHGYQVLGDVINVTIEKLSNLTLPIRTLASTDGTTHAGVYAFPSPKVPGGDRPMMIDLESEFSDGVFVTTGNNEGLNFATNPPGLLQTRLPVATPVDELIRRHEQSVQQYLADHPQVTARQVLTLSDVMEAQQRMSAMKSEFRKKIGYVDPEEVRRVAKSKPGFDDESANIAARAVDAARRQQAEDANPPPTDQSNGLA